MRRRQRTSTIAELRARARARRFAAAGLVAGYLVGRRNAPTGALRFWPLLLVAGFALLVALDALARYLVAGALILLAWWLVRRWRARHAPVPWDADYRPERDPLPHDRRPDDEIPY